MNMPFLKQLEHLPQNPSGFAGKLFGKVMEWTNGNAYRQALKALAPIDDELYLELGFGTGRFAEMLLSTTTDTFMAGVDPTATMVQIATERLVDRGWSDRIELEQGTDELLPWEDGLFHGIIAIHCFQFWSDPDRSLTEIGRVLRPAGRIIIALRDNTNHTPDWLPNPLSRSGKEAELTIKLLEKHDYIVTEHPAAGSSQILRADRIASQLS
jgi:ubiquinone/menaquinone biosynthesis C-methylase UbiE